MKIKSSSHPEYDVEYKESEFDAGIAGERSFSSSAATTSTAAKAKTSASSQTHQTKSLQPINVVAVNMTNVR